MLSVLPSARGWDVRIQEVTVLGAPDGTPYSLSLLEWWGRHPIADGDVRLERDGDRVLVWRQGALPDYAGRPARTLEEVVDLLRVRRAPDPAPADPADPTEDPTAPEALCARIGALLARGETMLTLEGRAPLHLQVVAFNASSFGPDAREELHEALAAMEATAPAPTPPPREPRWLASVRDRLGQESDEDTAWAAGPHVGPHDVARERERLGIPAYQPPPDPLALYRPWRGTADELAAHLEALPRAEWEVVWRAFGAPKGTRAIERVTVAIMAGSARSA